MIRSKKIMTDLFPKLGTLPQTVIDQMLHKANDGMLLYSPRQAQGKVVGQYYCLKCGSHGEIEGENIMCLNCNNRNVRPFHNDSYRSKVKGNCRYVSMVDDYIVCQDFYWFVAEKPEEGPKIELSENSRFFISDRDFALYDCNYRYPYGAPRQQVWTQRRKIGQDLQRHTLFLENKELENHPTVSKFFDFLTESTSGLAEALTFIFSTKTEDELKMPDVEFPEHDYSVITDPGSWEVSNIAEPIPGTDEFERQMCWCTNCGEFYEKIRETKYSMSSNCCLACGHVGYRNGKLYIIVDGIETDDQKVLLRVHGVEKKREFDGPLLRGFKPVVKTSHLPQYTEYILISPDGDINFFNHIGKEMDRMITPKKNYDRTQVVYFTDAAANLIKNSKAMKRTGFAEWMHNGATPRYFEYLKGMPCLEIFAKMGMSALVHDILEKELSDIPQYLRKTGKDSRMSKLTKPQINSLRRAPVCLKHLIAYMRVLNRDEEVLFEDFNDVASRSHERHVLDIMCVGVPGMTVAKIKDYMLRVDDAQCCQPSESMQLWADYLRMLKELEADLTDTKLVFPNSLKREHDKATRKVQQIQDEKLKEAFEQKAEDNEWLAFKGKSLSAVIPRMMTELYEEGRKLNHCVGTYARTVSEGKSIIAFVRKNNSLSEPYCTVEIRDKRIVQARGLANREGVAFPGVKSFLSEWSKEKGLKYDVA